MKKWILILAVGITATSCQWWHETFDDPEECTEWYLEELSKTSDLKEFEDIYNDYTSWINDLNLTELYKASQAEKDWMKAHEDKWEKINERQNKVYEKYKYEPTEEE